MLNFLKRSGSAKKYPTGAILSKPDVRNIPLARVQNVSTDFPSRLWIDTTMLDTFDQKRLGACVGMAHVFTDIWQNFKETFKKIKLSPRWLYAKCKKIDGLRVEGTDPKVALYINKQEGCATEDTVPNNCDLSHEEYINIVETDEMKKDAYPYRSGGYAEVSNTPEGLKDALNRNGIFPITISVGNYSNPLKKGNQGYHRVVLVGYGYSTLKIKNGVAVPSGTNKNRFFFKNSWSDKWGYQGYGYFDFDSQELHDLFIQTDIPNEVLEEAKQGAKVVISRETDNGKETLGSLTASYNGQTFTCKTLELPDKNNARNISCIPKGQYICKKKYSPKFGYNVYEVQNVPNRSGIYIHVGNYYTDIAGCILVGKQHIDINGDGLKDVNYSRVTLDALTSFLGWSDFTLIIK